MYTVTLDNHLLHDPEIKEYQVYGGKIHLEVNKSGSFSFTIYPSNPNYNNIQRLKSVIEVYDGEKLIFRGRPLNDTTGIQKEVTIFCEGELAYLNDSVLDPYDFSGSITQYLQHAINSHNSQVESKKQFQLGAVTVTDPNNYIVRSNIDHVSTWEEIKAKLIDNLGGYLRVRRLEGVNYLDYLSDSNQITNQTIELTKNILRYQQDVKAQDIVTVLIPLGANLLDENNEETDERLTIESVNGGKKYIEHLDGIAKYGRIYGYRIFDGITTPSALKSRGETTLNNLVNLGVSIQIKALDMKFATDEDRIGFFDYVRIVSKPHNIDEDFLVKKQTIDLDYPENNIIEVGIESSSFTVKQLQTDNVLKQIKSDYVTNQKMYGISESLYQEMSEIIQESNRISLEVEEVKQTTYTKTEVDNKIKATTEWTIGSDGYWYADGVKTDKKAIGEDGTVADIWTIGANGNWYKNGVDTGNPSQGADGQPTYTWVKYADTPTSGMSDYADGKKYIGMAFNKPTPTETTNYGDYQWSLMPQNITTEGRNYVLNSTRSFDQYIEMYLSEPTETGVTYTFSVETTQTGALEFEFFDADGLTYQSVTMPSGTRSITVEFTDNWDRFYQTTEATITKSWLTKSNQQMGWSPAPEDLESRVSEAENEVVRVETEMSSNFDLTTQEILLERSTRETQYGTLYDELTQNTEKISLVEGQIQSEVTARETQGDQIMSELNSQITQTSDNFQIMFNQLQAGQALTDGQLQEFQTYFRFDINGAIVGKSGSPIEFFQQNDMIGFRENGEVIAFWQEATMNVDNLIALVSIIIGTHQIKKYDNSNLSDITSIVQYVDRG